MKEREQKKAIFGTTAKARKLKRKATSREREFGKKKRKKKTEERTIEKERNFPLNENGDNKMSFRIYTIKKY